MLTNTYEIKGANLQTSFFISYLESESKQSKFYGLTVSISKGSSDALTVVLKHGDSDGIKKYADWLKNASKGASKVTSIRKIS